MFKMQEIQEILVQPRGHRSPDYQAGALRSANSSPLSLFRRIPEKPYRDQYLWSQLAWPETGGIVQIIAGGRMCRCRTSSFEPGALTAERSDVLDRRGCHMAEERPLSHRGGRNAADRPVLVDAG